MSTNDQLRKMIVDEAEKHVLKVSDHPRYINKNGERRGYQLLRRILDEACEQRFVWSPPNINAIRTPGQWLRTDGRGGTTRGEGAIHWCGIFATWVLQQAGVPAKWQNSRILPSGPDSKILHRKRKWMSIDKFDKDAIAPGDVCVVAKANHHFIIVNGCGSFRAKVLCGGRSPS